MCIIPGGVAELTRIEHWVLVNKHSWDEYCQTAGAH